MDGRDLKNNDMREHLPLPPPVFKRKSGIFKWGVAMVVGILIIFSGGIWVTLSIWTPPPSASSYSNYHEYQKDLSEWRNSTEMGNLYGRIMMEIGALTLMLVGFLSVFDPTVDDRERNLMIVVALVSLFILVLISVGLFVSSPYPFT